MGLIPEETKEKGKTIMKKMKKLLALLVAMAMVLSMGMMTYASGLENDPPADEEEETPAAATGSITITLPTEKQAPTKAVTYTIYKVFDATVDANDNTKVSYTLCSGDTLSDAMTAAGFSVDGQGNVSGPASLNQAAIDAIAAYVTSSDIVTTVTSSVGDLSVTTGALAYGYYYITTSTGSVVTIDSNNNTPTVKDKNVIPDVKKSAGTEYNAASLKAIAAVGTDQDFTAQITKTHGAKNLKFTDTMTNMTYNGDLVITVGGETVSPSTTIDTDAADETFKVTGASGASSFTVEFDNEYIAGLADDTVITLNYSGKITSDALTVDPAKNKATLTSGDGNTDESDEVEVYNAKITVNKVDEKNAPLAGAKFKLKNADGKYYAGATTDGTANWTDTGIEVEAVHVAASTTTDPETGDTVTVPESYTAVFTGLGAGTYTLVESTIPKGYNKAADQTITVSDSGFTTANLEQEATVTNRSGAELPSTGGIGTTIFYIVGGILVIGAGVVMITRRRMDVQ